MSAVILLVLVLGKQQNRLMYEWISQPIESEGRDSGLFWMAWVGSLHLGHERGVRGRCCLWDSWKEWATHRPIIFARIWICFCRLDLGFTERLLRQAVLQNDMTLWFKEQINNLTSSSISCCIFLHENSVWGLHDSRVVPVPKMPPIPHYHNTTSDTTKWYPATSHLGRN